MKQRKYLLIKEFDEKQFNILNQIKKFHENDLKNLGVLKSKYSIINFKIIKESEVR